MPPSCYSAKVEKFILRKIRVLPFVSRDDVLIFYNTVIKDRPDEKDGRVGSDYFIFSVSCFTNEMIRSNAN